MPHVHIKMIAGRTQQQKQALAKAMTDALISTLGSTEDSVSVAIEDIAREDWTAAVYGPDIQGKSELIYKRPGYDPFG